MILLTPLHSESESHSSPHPTAPSAASLPHREKGVRGAIFALALLSFAPSTAHAALNIPITVNLSESVNVTGTPQIAVDVGGTTRYATYTSGTGTNALTFTLAPQAGDVDLDGVTVSSPIQLNGGTIKDSKGNNATLTFTPPNTANVKVNYPSLGMDFVYDADGRYTLNGTPYNDLSSFLTAAGGSFTRASIGTYYDSTGTLQTAASGAPRFDYDPVTHAAKGILIEESRTNLLTYSALSSISGTGWSGSNTSIMTINNPGSLPVGTSACIRDEVNAGQVNGYITKSLVLSPSTVYTFSIWVYVPSSVPAGKAYLSAWYSNGGWQTISSQATVERDQWVRKSLTFTTNATYTTTIVGAGVSGASAGLQTYACLAQLELGRFPTSYIPTTTASVTRAADTLTMPTGTWYHGSMGTVAAQASLPYLGGTTYPRVMALSDDTANNRISLLIGDGDIDQIYAQIHAANVQSLGAIFSVYVPNTPIKLGIAYKPNDAIAASSGVLSSANTSAVIPSMNTFAMGTFSPSIPRYLNGNIQKIKYYPARVANTQLQLLTQ